MAASAGMSVTSVLTRISTFDTDSIAASVARSRGTSSQDVIAGWDETSRVGLLIHEVLEGKVGDDGKKKLGMIELYDKNPRIITKTWKKRKAAECKAAIKTMSTQFYLDALNHVHVWLKKRKNLDLIGVEVDVSAVFELEDLDTGDVYDQEVHGRIDGVFTYTSTYRGVDTERVLIVDWKTGSSTYSHAKHLFQVCLYAFIYSKQHNIEYSEMRVCIVYTQTLNGETTYHRAIQNPAKLKSVKRMYQYLAGAFDGTDAF